MEELSHPVTESKRAGCASRAKWKKKKALAFNHQAQRGPLPVELQCRVHNCCCVLILSFSVSWILDYRNCTCSLYIATLSWVRVMIYKVIMLARPGHRITGDQATQHKAEPPRGLDWQDGWTDGCHSVCFCGSLHMHFHSYRGDTVVMVLIWWL